MVIEVTCVICLHRNSVFFCFVYFVDVDQKHAGGAGPMLELQVEKQAWYAARIELELLAQKLVGMQGWCLNSKLRNKRGLQDSSFNSTSA